MNTFGGSAPTLMMTSSQIKSGQEYIYRSFIGLSADTFIKWGDVGC